MAEQNATTDDTYDNLAELAGTGWHDADVERDGPASLIERYSVGDVEFVAGPRDDRPGRSDHGDGRHLGSDEEGSSRTHHYALNDLVIDIEADYQPGTTSPRLRVREQ